LATPALETSERSAQQLDNDVLDAADVVGKRIVSTRLQRSVTIRAENATAALEVMSRFAANPKWLIYLPPTMSPCATSTQIGLLEHPAEAFAYYRGHGVSQVVCEEKHMGSRAVVVVCQDEDAARERFGSAERECGIVYTRTGRRFFNDPQLEQQLLERLRQALTRADFWSEFQTRWACLDCELMPWSATAQDLLRGQSAALGAAGNAALPKVAAVLEQAAARLDDDVRTSVAELQTKVHARWDNVGRFVAAYRHYCWPVESLADLKLAPFHLLATEQSVPIDRDHVWHMQLLAKVCEYDPQLLLATPFRVVDVNEPSSAEEGVAWWEQLTARGGEGMVVKSMSFVAHDQGELLQPAVKCRGREYLRIIYGPDYTADEHLRRLRNRGLGRKRSLALREFALGIEALERFVRREPLRRVHECVFGVLALESEPVDPRL
jgi:protein phosphatase